MCGGKFPSSAPSAHAKRQRNDEKDSNYEDQEVVLIHDALLFIGNRFHIVYGGAVVYARVC